MAETQRGYRYEVPEWVARFNGWFFDRWAGFINLFVGRVKRQVFGDLPAEVVELGAGAGANFAYLEGVKKVVAVEPNPHMHPRLERRAADHLEVEIVAGVGEAIDLPDDSVEAVVCSLVLCTVTDPARVVGEVRRILRPGGRFIFVEHVGAPHGSARRWLQRAIKPPWRYIFEGCEPDRDTHRVLTQAGFENIDITHHLMHSPFLPANTLIAGTATA